MQEEVQIMTVKVFTNGSKRYLNGSTLNGLGYGSLVTNGYENLYEFSPEQIKEMMRNYERRFSDIELEEELIQLEEEKTVQSVPTEENEKKSDDEIREEVWKDLGFGSYNSKPINHRSTEEKTVQSIPTTEENAKKSDDEIREEVWKDLGFGSYNSKPINHRSTEEKTVQPVPTEENAKKSDDEIREEVWGELNEMLGEFGFDNSAPLNHHSTK